MRAGDAGGRLSGTLRRHHPPGMPRLDPHLRASTPRTRALLRWAGPRHARPVSVAAVRSDGSGEFGERGLDMPMGASVKPKFVMAATQVLHQRMTAHDHSRRMVAFESTHWSEPGFEPAVVALDAVVR